MKPFKCIANRESFGRAVDIASFGGRPVEIEVGADRAVVRGTDPDLFLEVGFEAETACSEGIVSVPSKRLSQIARELTDDELVLFVESGPRRRLEIDQVAPPQSTADQEFRTLVVEGRRASFRLSLYAQRNSRLKRCLEPDIATPQVDADALCAALTRTAFAAGERCGKYELEGVYFDSSGDRLELVGTDGTQMAACELECSEKIGSGIVPIPTTKAIRAVFSDSKTPVLIAIEQGAVIVTGDCGTVSSSLFPTSYPRWREALDATSDPLETIEVDPNSLNRSLRLAVASFSGAGVRRVAEFTFVNGAIRIKARDDEFGSVVELPICRTGPDVSVDLPHSQLTEFLSHVSEPLSVTLGAAPASPVVFFVPGYRYAVSPITQ